MVESTDIKVVAMNPSHTFQACPSCGAAIEKDLSVHVPSCPFCGYAAGRDTHVVQNNLARTIKSARTGRLSDSTTNYAGRILKNPRRDEAYRHKYASGLSTWLTAFNDWFERHDPTNIYTWLIEREDARQPKVQLPQQPTSEFLGRTVGYLGQDNKGSLTQSPKTPPSQSTNTGTNQQKYDSTRAGIQTIPDAALPPGNTTNQEGLGVIGGSSAVAATIQRRIHDASRYVIAESGESDFQRDADILKNAIKNKDNPEWLKQNKEKVDLALRRIFEYGAIQWATEGFQITDPTIVQQRIKKLYDVALGNGRLDPRDLDLVYSRFTKQLGLPDREVIVDPVTAKQITVKNSTTFEMFKNWMYSKEVPWWYKAALVVGIPLTVAGLLTRIGGGSAGVSFFLSGAGLLLSGIGGIFAYNQMRELEAKRIVEQEAKLKELREEQDKYDQQEAEYSKFGPSGENFFNEFFDLDEKGRPIVKADRLFNKETGITDDNIQSFLSAAEASGRREEAERILYVLSILHNKEERIKREYLANKEHTNISEKAFFAGEVAGAVATGGALAPVVGGYLAYTRLPGIYYILQLGPKKDALLEKLKSFNTAGNTSFEEIAGDFKKLLDFAPFEAKSKILEDMGYDPATVSSFKYIKQFARRGEVPYKDDNELFSDLILGKASPEQLYAAIDNNKSNVIIRDATKLPRSELERTPNRNLGVLIARNSWLWEEQYDKEIIIPSIIRAMVYYGVTYSDLVFLNSLAMDVRETLTLIRDRPKQIQATTPQEVTARLAGDILNAGLIPPISPESDPKTYKAIYGENTAHLSVPADSLKTFIRIARNNMDYVNDPRYAIKSLATLMAYDLYKNHKNSVTMAYIDQVIRNSNLPPQQKEAVLAQTKDLAVRDPLAAIFVLGEFNPIIAEQINDPALRVPPKSKQAASAVIALLN